MAKLGKGPAAGKGDVGVIPQAKAVVAALIGLDDRLVVGLQVFLAGVDAIHILHDKLTPTHNTTLGAQLVAEFVLELVDADGQVFVTFQVATQQFDNRLLVRPAKADFGAILQVRLEPHIHQLIAPAASLLPELLALQGAHQQFLAVDAVHFFADNLLDILEHGQAQRRVGIDAGHRLVHVASANQQLGVVRHLIGGSLFAGTGEGV